jgi:hypothetical protein
MKIYIILFFCIFSFSCANIVPLEGGPKDMLPPKLLRTAPDTFSTSFNQNKISLYFDEYINLKNPTQEIYISPPIPDFQVVSKGKFIEITFSEKLSPETTYQIDFGNAIADNNEGNVLNSYRYVFSTGTAIDSGKINLRVVDAETLTPINLATCLLYRLNSDSLPLKSQPNFIAKTNKDGQASISYLPNEIFRVASITERDNNYLFDAPDEKIGFMLNTITANVKNEYTIRLFEQRKEKKITFVKRTTAFSCIIKFSAPVDLISISDILNKENKIITEFLSPVKDSVLCWSTTLEDTMQWRVIFDGIEDTLYVFSQEKSQSKESKPSVKLRHEKINPRKPLEIISNIPVMDIDTLKIFIKERGKNIKKEVLLSRDGPRKIEIKSPLKSQEKYVLLFLPEALRLLDGGLKDTVILEFKTSPISEFSQLELSINGLPASKQIIGKLFNEKNEIVVESILKSTDNGSALWIVDDLLNGEYKIRVVVDENKNGRWDAGDIYTKTLPESVFIYPRQLTIQKSFDTNIRWDIEKEN